MTSRLRNNGESALLSETVSPSSSVRDSTDTVSVRVIIRKGFVKEGVFEVGQRGMQEVFRMTPSRQWQILNSMLPEKGSQCGR